MPTDIFNGLSLPSDYVSTESCSLKHQVACLHIIRFTWKSICSGRSYGRHGRERGCWERWIACPSFQTPSVPMRGLQPLLAHLSDLASLPPAAAGVCGEGSDCGHHCTQVHPVQLGLLRQGRTGDVFLVCFGHSKQHCPVLCVGHL